MNQSLSEFLTIPQASRQLGISTRTIRDAIHSGVLPAYRLRPGGWPRIRAGDLEAWAMSHAAGPQAS